MNNPMKDQSHPQSLHVLTQQWPNTQHSGQNQKPKSENPGPSFTVSSFWTCVQRVFAVINAGSPSKPK